MALTSLTLNDSRGKSSKTLFIVWTCLIVLIVKFALGGIDIGFGAFPVISAGEFGLAATGFIGAWVMRENKAKELDRQNAVNTQNDNDKGGLLP